MTLPTNVTPGTPGHIGFHNTIHGEVNNLPTNYQARAERDQPNGYPSLDANMNLPGGTQDDYVQASLIPIKQRLDALEGKPGSAQADIKLGVYAGSVASLAAYESNIGSGWIAPNTWQFPAFDTDYSIQGYGALVGAGRSKLLISLPNRLSGGKYGTWAGFTAGNYIPSDGTAQIGANGACDTKVVANLTYLQTLAVAHPETEIIVAFQEPDVSWTQNPPSAGAIGTPAQFKTWAAHFVAQVAANAPGVKVAFILGNGTRCDSDMGTGRPNDATGWWPTAIAASITYVGFDPYSNSPITPLATLLGRDGQALFGKAKPCIVTSGVQETGDDGTKKAQWYTDVLALSLDNSQFPSITDINIWNSAPYNTDSTTKAFAAAQAMFTGNLNPPVSSGSDWNEIPSAITATDSITDGSGTVATTVLHVGATIPVGAHVFLVFGSNSNPTFLTVTDTQGNTYVIDNQKQTTGTAKGSIGQASAHVTTALGPTDTITITQSATNAVRWGCGKAGTGIVQASWFDTSGSAEGNSTNPDSGPTSLITSDNVLLIGGTVMRTGLTDILAAGTDGNTHSLAAIDHRGPVTAAGASANFAAEFGVIASAELAHAVFNSKTNAAQWGAIVATYKIVTAGGGTGGTELTAHKDQPGGYPSLDANKKIPINEMPLGVLLKNHTQASVSFASLTTDQDLFLASLPYAVDQIIRFHASGTIIVANSATARNITWRLWLAAVQIGGVLAGVSHAVATSVSKTVDWQLDGTLHFRTGTLALLAGTIRDNAGAASTVTPLYAPGIGYPTIGASPQNFHLTIANDHTGLGDSATFEEYFIERIA